MRLHSTFLGVGPLALLFAAAPACACVEGELRGDAVTVTRDVGATPPGEGTTMHMVGSGWFRAAEVVKRGGSSDQTYVTLELDGQPMITASFATLKNPWNQLGTDFLIANVRTSGDTSTMTIWYTPELRFTAIAALRIDVQEEGVEALNVRAVLNKPLPHTHLPGQPGPNLALPAFK
jgi:hypothetical protein